MSDQTLQGTAVFRPEFADEIIGFLGGMFPDLHERERSHAIGVVANTLAALAVNNSHAVDVRAMGDVLAALDSRSRHTVETMVHDPSVGLLFPQSAGICRTIQAAIGDRID